ncbi:hypothetical protein [Leisingera daeponensis]|uniref:hypothetical protein n=1 Tax=Leisingera daeponensis TaxID=405746 RepID=UPI001C9790BB|nr:hypothetical protein [Leisingera daeponensis]MBY6058639.1 hypothetical protein [Leisingera daeponensis]
MKPILCTLAFILAPLPALAAGFERPTPQPQTETAEFWFLIASILLVAALGYVHLLVSRR